MAVTEGGKKKPPSFHFLPKSRAKQLKKSWVEDRKIRSKWKAQKKREGLSGTPVDDAADHRQDHINADSEPDSSSFGRDKMTTPTPTPRHDTQSLRDLRRMAYATNPPHTQKSDSLRLKRASRNPHVDRDGNPPGRENRQPNMKLRMNVLLEKIKRDHS